MKRRQLIKLGALATLAPLAGLSALEAVAKTDSLIKTLHSNWRDFIPSGHKLVAAQPKLDVSADSWRQQLPEDAFEVLFEEDTERPFSSALNNEKRDGVFICRACDLPLFTSAMKYDSGTGWPSFFTAIPGHLGTKKDYKLIWPRTEYHCIKCGGHQGHVFDDGPAPTGERWCNNGLALSFVPKAG